MEIIVYIILFVLLSLDVYLIYKSYKLEKRLNTQAQDQKKQLVEAGNAITDTLKIAFDNLKRNSSDHNKINAKISEHNSRIHRLEQHENRSVKGLTQREEMMDNEPEAPITRKNKKE